MLKTSCNNEIEGIKYYITEKVAGRNVIKDCFILDKMETTLVSDCKRDVDAGFDVNLTPVLTAIISKNLVWCFAGFTDHSADLDKQ